MLAITLIGAARADVSPIPFRVGFSSSMFSDVNDNDARAAIKVWGESIAVEQGVPSDPDPVLFGNVQALRSALIAEQVDAVGISAREYHSLIQQVALSPLFITYHGGQITERYVLLTNRDGPVRELAGLRGRRLVLQDNVRTDLAEVWLESQLIESGLVDLKGMAVRITREPQLAKAILPVFFGQADACLVTRRGLDTMIELNPQLQWQLEVLLESGPLVPALFAFRDSYDKEFKEKISAGILTLRHSAAGRQLLTIFHSEDIGIFPAAALDTAMDLISRHESLRLR